MPHRVKKWRCCISDRAESQRKRKKKTEPKNTQKRTLSDWQKKREEMLLLQIRLFPLLLQVGCAWCCCDHSWMMRWEKVFSLFQTAFELLQSIDSILRTHTHYYNSMAQISFAAELMRQQQKPAPPWGTTTNRSKVRFRTKLSHVGNREEED